MKKLNIILLLSLIAIKGYSQVNNNSLFLLIDREIDSITIIENNFEFTISYKYENEKQNWALRLGHYNISNYKQNLLKYLLPKEMIEEYTRRGIVQEITPFFNKLDSLDRGGISKYLRTYYPPYFYEYLDEQKFRIQRRWNIFFIFKSDLEKKYVPCYEVSLTQMTMVEY